MELYNEEFLADKRVGTLGSDGKWDYNKNWWGGANNKDKAFAEQIQKDGTLKNQANKITAASIADEENCNGEKNV